MLIIFTQGFKNTHSHRQLISFAGLSLTEYSSGTSIKGGGRIYKRDSKAMRDVLYMCAMNAKLTNPACQQLLQRLKANGKSGKQALIAVMNKLLKQVFTVVKNETVYQTDCCSGKPEILFGFLHSSCYGLAYCLLSSQVFVCRQFAVIVVSAVGSGFKNF